MSPIQDPLPSLQAFRRVPRTGVIYVTNEAGLTTVISAGPEFKVLATPNVDEYTLSSLAIADRQIFLRTADHLYCIEDRG